MACLLHDKSYTIFDMICILKGIYNFSQIDGVAAHGGGYFKDNLSELMSDRYLRGAQFGEARSVRGL